MWILQGSLLDPLLFNIFVNDIFVVVEESDICNFGDDKTLYSHDSNLPLILSNLEHNMRNLHYWFEIYPLKENPGNFWFLILGRKNHLNCSLKIGSIIVEESDEV